MDRWAKNQPHVLTWITQYGSVEQRKFQAHNLWIFCESVKMNPNELLALKDNPASLKAERLLDSFVANEDLDIPNSVKRNAVNCVRAFFAAHYKDLAKRAGRMDLEKVKPYRKPTKEDLRKLWDACYNPRDRSMLVSLPNATAMAKETIVNLKWKHIEEGWENIDCPHISIPPELVKGHGRRRYKDVRQETFLTPEAKEDLTKYREWMERVKGVKFTPETNVYLTVQSPFKAVTYDDIGKATVELSKRAGVEYSLHDARRYVQTALEEAKINPNWARKIRGRKVRGEESPYSRPEIEKLREAYRSALQYLQFRELTSLAELRERQEVSEELMAKMDMGEGLTKEDLEKAKRHKLKLIIARHKRFVEAKKEDPQDCPNGTNCPTFKEIGEADLLSHLQSGWKIEYKSSNGRLIVRRER